MILGKRRENIWLNVGNANDWKKEELTPLNTMNMRTGVTWFGKVV